MAPNSILYQWYFVFTLRKKCSRDQEVSKSESGEGCEVAKYCDITKAIYWKC